MRDVHLFPLAQTLGHLPILICSVGLYHFDHITFWKVDDLDPLKQNIGYTFLRKYIN